MPSSNGAIFFSNFLPRKKFGNEGAPEASVCLRANQAAFVRHMAEHEAREEGHCGFSSNEPGVRFKTP
jgi:hypothetical protein